MEGIDDDRSIAETPKRAFLFSSLSHVWTGLKSELASFVSTVSSNNSPHQHDEDIKTGQKRSRSTSNLTTRAPGDQVDPDGKRRRIEPLFTSDQGAVSMPNTMAMALEASSTSRPRQLTRTGMTSLSGKRKLPLASSSKHVHFAVTSPTEVAQSEQAKEPVETILFGDVTKTWREAREAERISKDQKRIEELEHEVQRLKKQLASKSPSEAPVQAVFAPLPAPPPPPPPPPPPKRGSNPLLTAARKGLRATPPRPRAQPLQGHARGPSMDKEAFLSELAACKLRKVASLPARAKNNTSSGDNEMQSVLQRALHKKFGKALESPFRSKGRNAVAEEWESPAPVRRGAQTISNSASAPSITSLGRSAVSRSTTAIGQAITADIAVPLIASSSNGPPPRTTSLPASSSTAANDSLEASTSSTTSTSSRLALRPRTSPAPPGIDLGRDRPITPGRKRRSLLGTSSAEKSREDTQSPASSPVEMRVERRSVDMPTPPEGLTAMRANKHKRSKSGDESTKRADSHKKGKHVANASQDGEELLGVGSKAPDPTRTLGWGITHGDLALGGSGMEWEQAADKGWKAKSGWI